MRQDLHVLYAFWTALLISGVVLRLSADARRLTINGAVAVLSLLAATVVWRAAGAPGSPFDPLRPRAFRADVSRIQSAIRTNGDIAAANAEGLAADRLSPSGRTRNWLGLGRRGAGRDIGRLLERIPLESATRSFRHTPLTPRPSILSTPSICDAPVRTGCYSVGRRSTDEARSGINRRRRAKCSAITRSIRRSPIRSPLRGEPTSSFYDGSLTDAVR